MQNGQVSVQTPLVPPTSPDNPEVSLTGFQWFFTQGAAFVYNVANCAIYLVSADDMMHQVAKVSSAPEFIVHQRGWMMGNISDFSEPWHRGVFGAYLFFTASFAVTNQFSMPNRISGLLGWQAEKSHGAGWKQAASIFSTIWKTIVSNMSLLSVVANIEWLGFNVGLAMFVLAIPGNIFGQLSNFLGSSAKLCGQRKLPKMSIKAVAGFCAFSYMLSGIALYFDSINRSLHKLHWMEKDLTSLEGAAFWLTLIPHLLLNGNFSLLTCIGYYPRFEEMLTLSNEVDATSENTRDLSSDASTASSDVEVNQAVESTSVVVSDEDSAEESLLPNYHFADKFGPLDALAAFYKTASTYFSILAMINMAVDISHPDVVIGGGITVIGLFQFCNYLSQQTFYAQSPKALSEKKVLPGKGGMFAAKNRLAGFCEKMSCTREVNLVR